MTRQFFPASLESLETIHKLPDQVNAKAANWALLRGQAEVGGGMAGGIERPPVIRDFHREFVLLNAQSDADVDRGMRVVAVHEDVRHVLFQCQVGGPEDFRRHAVFPGEGLQSAQEPLPLVGRVFCKVELQSRDGFRSEGV